MICGRNRALRLPNSLFCSASRCHARGAEPPPALAPQRIRRQAGALLSLRYQAWRGRHLSLGALSSGCPFYSRGPPSYRLKRGILLRLGLDRARLDDRQTQFESHRKIGRIPWVEVSTSSNQGRHRKPLNPVSRNAGRQSVPATRLERFR